MKKLLVSSSLSALLALPAFAAVEVYNGDNGSLDVYGSIRGYVGGAAVNGYNNQGGTYTLGTFNTGGAIMGIQDNSHFGFNFKNENVFAKIEIGANEPGVIKPSLTTNNDSPNSPGLRMFYGGYDTGLGKIVFGKMNTPMIDPGFVSDWLNNNNGGAGFGGVATGKRLIQLQYQVAGLSVAFIEDALGGGRVARNTNGQQNTRFAVSYEVKGEKAPLFKIAYTYKNTANPTATDTNRVKKEAYLAWVGVRPTFGSAFISLLGAYSLNGDLLEQDSRFNAGGYQHTLFTKQDAIRIGGRAELGVNFSSKVGFVVGGGYQLTDAKNATKDKYNAWSVFAQLPYKVSQNFTLNPQVSYYAISHNNYYTPEQANGPRARGVGSLVAGVNLKYDF